MEELGAKDKLEFLSDSHSMNIHVAAHEILERYDSWLFGAYYILEVL